MMPNKVSVLSVRQCKKSLNVKTLKYFHYPHSARAKTHALVLAGQEAAAPETREQGLVGLVAAALRDHDHERRQLPVFAADAVTEPRAEARTPGLLVAVIGLASPGLVLTIAAYSLLVQYRDHSLVRRSLLAMQYAAAALLVSSALRIAQAASGGQFHVVGMALVLGLFFVAYVMQLGVVLVLVLAAAIGLLIL